MEKLKVDDVGDRIGIIMQEVTQMGGNDSEIPTLTAILNSYKAGKITPEEALKQAHAVIERKASYH